MHVVGSGVVLFVTSLFYVTQPWTIFPAQVTAILIVGIGARAGWKAFQQTYQTRHKFEENNPLLYPST